VMVLPSGRTSRVRSLASFDGDLDAAHPPMSATITLEDNIDVSRGDMLVAPERPPAVARSFTANVVWMHETPGVPGAQLLLKHTSRTVSAEIQAIAHRVNMRTLEREDTDSLALNEIAQVRIDAAQPLYFDPYDRNRWTGSFSLIDPLTNATVGAGMIIAAVVEDRRRTREERHALEPVTPAERFTRWRHVGAVVAYGTREDVGDAFERELFERGAAVVRLHATLEPAVVERLTAAGLLIAVRGGAGIELPQDAKAAADALVRHYEQAGVLLTDEVLTEGEGI
jgi:hypothetical protein